MAVAIGPVHISEDPDGVVDAPDEAAGEEGGDEDGAIDGLIDGAGELELVAEPVDVKERAAELVQQEYRCGEVDEGTLRHKRVSGRRQQAQGMTQWAKMENRMRSDIHIPLQTRSPH